MEYLTRTCYARACASTASLGSRFCETHHVPSRAAYRKYKRLDEAFDAAYQQGEESATALQTLHARAHAARDARTSFRDKWIDPARRDNGHDHIIRWYNDLAQWTEARLTELHAGHVPTRPPPAHNKRAAATSPAERRKPQPSSQARLLLLRERYDEIQRREQEQERRDVSAIEDAYRSSVREAATSLVQADHDETARHPTRLLLSCWFARFCRGRLQHLQNAAPVEPREHLVLVREFLWWLLYERVWPWFSQSAGEYFAVVYCVELPALAALSGEEEGVERTRLGLATDPIATLTTLLTFVVDVLPVADALALAELLAEKQRGTQASLCQQLVLDPSRSEGTERALDGRWQARMERQMRAFKETMVSLRVRLDVARFEQVPLLHRRMQLQEKLRECIGDLHSLFNDPEVQAEYAAAAADGKTDLSLEPIKQVTAQLAACAEELTASRDIVVP